MATNSENEAAIAELRGLVETISANNAALSERVQELSDALTAANENATLAQTNADTLATLDGDVQRLQNDAATKEQFTILERALRDLAERPNETVAVPVGAGGPGLYGEGRQGFEGGLVEHIIGKYYSSEVRQYFNAKPLEPEAEPAS